MKGIVHILFLQLLALPFYGQQFNLRGDVKDEGGNFLPRVTIRQQSSGKIFYTSSTGSFDIPSFRETDTLVFSCDGFQSEWLRSRPDKYSSVRLKLLPGVTTQVKRYKLASLTKDLSRESQRKWNTGDETYTSIVENQFVNADKYPSTGMSLNIDRASYSNVRRLINLDLPVTPDAVRIEEMLNYFNFGYQAPEPGTLFKISSVITTCPWKTNDQLLFLNIFSKKLELDSLPPTQLVFLIDISGSMDMPNRLPLLKSAFKMLAMNLREQDTVSIVVYGGAVGVMLFPTSGCEKEKICKAIDELEPGGSTPGASGILLAYDIAKKHFIKEGNNRVILATDGDFNVGLKTEQELDEMISKHRESGIYLTCLGVGMGNYKDSKIQTLARKGNGNFAYIDSYQEAEKILLKEFTKTLYTVADDVYMNLTFNPDFVKNYRLIGFDNKVGALVDTGSVIEGGEIGSGHSLVAAFEIEPANRISGKNKTGELASVKLQYKLPGDSLEKQLQDKIDYNFVEFEELDPMYRFASSVIMFGSVLKNSPFTKNISWGDVLYHASESANPTDINQSQFVELVYKAKSTYTKSKKKKKRQGSND